MDGQHSGTLLSWTVNQNQFHSFEWIWICGSRESHYNTTPFASPARPGPTAQRLPRRVNQSLLAAFSAVSLSTPHWQWCVHQTEWASKHFARNPAQGADRRSGRGKNQKMPTRETAIWTPCHRLRCWWTWEVAE